MDCILIIQKSNNLIYLEIKMINLVLFYIYNYNMITAKDFIN